MADFLIWFHSIDCIPCLRAGSLPFLAPWLKSVHTIHNICSNSSSWVLVRVHSVWDASKFDRPSGYFTSPIVCSHRCQCEISSFQVSTSWGSFSVCEEVMNFLWMYVCMYVWMNFVRNWYDLIWIWTIPTLIHNVIHVWTFHLFLFQRSERC